jgi:glycine betaine catabolism B
MEFIDNFLNKITMYRLVLYVLTLMVLAGVLFSFLGILPYGPVLFLAGTAFVIVTSLVLNEIFSFIFDAPTNVESVYITALILILIITPIKDIGDISYWMFLFWASVWGVASKYIFAIGKKHIFNPAAFAVAITALTINQYASWWIGTIIMAPFVILGGFLVVRKIRRFDLIASFMAVALIFIIGARATDIISSANLAYKTIFYTPILFFAFIMLTEPLTTPPQTSLRMLYGVFCGFLFSPLVHIGSLFFTPELSLLTANLFSYIVSPKQKLILKLKNKIQVAQDTYDFVFSIFHPFNFKPGKYMEWTLDHNKIDSRGNRRYFTVASSPTEKEIRIGVKFYPNGSSFKKKLLSMNTGNVIVASGLAGDFTLPKNKNKKLVFIAGGIGITPFRSMIKYLTDTRQKRNIVLLYSNRTPADIAYKDILNQAEKDLGMKIVYTVTDKITPENMWQGKTGYIDSKMIREEIPDYSERYFYLSGTHGMVTTFNDTLQGMGLKKSHIKKDFFPGFV